MNIIHAARRRISKMRVALGLSRRAADLPALAVMGTAWCNDFAGANPISWLCRTVFPLIKVRTDRLSHLQVFLDPTDASHFAIFEEVVLENVYDLDMVPFEPQLIVDCGGHIGLFTARAAARYPKVPILIFEPMPGNLRLIEHVVKSNSLNADIRPTAVGDREQTVEFFERQSFGGSIDSSGPGIKNSYPVQVTNLIDELSRFAASNLLIKMDIEGEEENLLPKLIPTLPPQCAVFFETHSADKGWNKISDAFSATGFNVKLLRNRDPFRDGFALRCNP